MGRQLGLILGINQYQDATFRPLQFAETDAKALAMWLVDTYGGNWAPADLQLVLGVHATRELAGSLISQVCIDMARPGDLVFIYFAGHAFVDEASGEGYLAFANTRYLYPATGMHLLSLVRQALAPSPAAQVVLLLDCFQTGSAWNRHRTSPFDFTPLLGTRLLHSLHHTQGRLLYCSCRGNESAPERGEKNLGIFTYCTIVALSDPRKGPTTGPITLQWLDTYLSRVLDNQHSPQVFGYEPRPIVLVGDMPSFAPVSRNGWESYSSPLAAASMILPIPSADQTVDHEQLSDLPVGQTLQGSADIATSDVEPVEKSIREILLLRPALSRVEYEEEKKELIKTMLDNFDNLKSIGEESKLSLRNFFTSYQEYLFERYWRWFSMNRFLGYPLLLLRPLAYFALSFLLINRLWLNINHTVPPVTFNFVYFLESLVPFFIFIFLYSLIFSVSIGSPIDTLINISNKNSNKNVTILLISSLSIFFILLYFILVNTWSHQLLYIAYIVATAILSYISRFFVIILIMEIQSIIFIFYNRKTIKNDPILVIIYQLIFLLITVESNSENWINLKQKQLLVLMLEEASRCIEYYLPQKIRIGDNANDVWLKETLKQVATALREKKRWILMPKKDTRDYFVKSIAATLISIVENNWDALERMEPEKITRPQLLNALTSFILKASKVILAAALPIVGFIIFQQTSFALTGATLVSTISILFIYAVTVIMAAIDPNLSSSITNTNAVKTWFK